MSATFERDDEHFWYLTTAEEKRAAEPRLESDECLNVAVPNDKWETLKMLSFSTMDNYIYRRAKTWPRFWVWHEGDGSLLGLYRFHHPKDAGEVLFKGNWKITSGTTMEEIRPCDGWREIPPWEAAKLIANAQAKAGKVGDDNASTKEERAMLQVIDERDAAAQALSQAFYLVTGRSPEWSNLFGNQDALDEIDSSLRLLREVVKEKTNLAWIPLASRLPDFADFPVWAWDAKYQTPFVIHAQPILSQASFTHWLPILKPATPVVAEETEASIISKAFEQCFSSCPENIFTDGWQACHSWLKAKGGV